MPVFTVDGISIESETYPTVEQIEAAKWEARKGAVSASTHASLMSAKNVGPLARRPALRPGETPT